MKTSFGLAIGLLMVCVSELSQASLIQWSATDGENDHWYSIFDAPQGINFNDAVTASENKGGILLLWTCQVSLFLSSIILCHQQLMGIINMTG